MAARAPLKSPSTSAVASSEPEALRTEIEKRHPVRLHLALILAACFGAGLIVTKLMLLAGVDAMWLRYAAAVVAGYATFLAGVRLWLAYAGYRALSAPAGSAVKSSASSSTGGSWLDLGSGGGGGRGLPGFRGGGGGSGGGGASVSFAEGGSASGRSVGLFSAVSSNSNSGSSGKSGGGSFDLGDGGWVLVALIALIAAVFGAAFYLVYMAPTILGDAAFAALLSGGLVRSARRIGTGGWVGSVVRDTWWPFAIVFVLALVFALTAQHYYPDAVTVGDVIRRL